MMNSPRVHDEVSLSVLCENGLTLKEARLYLTLLACGEANPAEVSKQSGIKRPTAYLILSALVERGLVTCVKRGRGQHYRALDPSILCQTQDAALQRLRSHLPELSALVGNHGSTPEMRVFQGVGGLRTVMEDSLSSKGEILCWVDVGLVTKKVFKRYWAEYVRKRVRAKISVRAIMVADETAQDFRRRDKEELRESVLISKARFPLHGEMNIYNDKIAILSYADLVGVIIQNQALADMQRSIFNLSFQIAKSVMSNRGS